MNRSNNSGSLRIALLAGTLGQGGAEKQLVYIARALLAAGVDARVYCLTTGEQHESTLRESGIEVVHFGAKAGIMARLARLTHLLRGYRPHIVQSMHFYTNLYAALAGRAAGAYSIGAIRNDTHHELQANGLWGQPLLRLTDALVANSRLARDNAIEMGVSPRRLHLLPNAIDLPAFDRAAALTSSLPHNDGTRAALVARLVHQKRVERFVEALALARRQAPALNGLVVGDGPEMERLTNRAGALGLDQALTFLGSRTDVPAILAGSDILALTSDHEGFPNAIMEGMAARLPVVTTPAGDASSIVHDGSSGYLVGFDNLRGLADRLALLALSPELRAAMGAAGRRLVEQHYSIERLPALLMSIYHEVARTNNNAELARLSDAHLAGQGLPHAS